MQTDRFSEEQPEVLLQGSSSFVVPLAVIDSLPNLPIMTSTRLQLELLVNDTVTDLKAVAEVILADPGATLQVLRLIGEEYSEAEDRPHRIEDCIVSLSIERCYETICSAGWPSSGAYVAEWQYCRRVAECARELARALDGFSPEEAYLIGLLHRVGGFPYLLGWSVSEFSVAEDEAMGVKLASHWRLPEFLLSAIEDHQGITKSQRWSVILGLANKLADS